MVFVAFESGATFPPREREPGSRSLCIHCLGSSSCYHSVVSATASGVISKASNRFAGDIDPDILSGSVGITDEGSNSPGVEDPIKITTGGLGCIGELVTGRLDLCVGVMLASTVRPLRTPPRAAWRTARLERRFG
jgi:hypothetical protein